MDASIKNEAPKIRNIFFMACIWSSKIRKDGQIQPGTGIQPGTRDEGQGTREQLIQMKNEK
jgi:hypothetical protein